MSVLRVEFQFQVRAAGRQDGKVYCWPMEQVGGRWTLPEIISVVQHGDGELRPGPSLGRLILSPDVAAPGRPIYDYIPDTMIVAP